MDFIKGGNPSRPTVHLGRFVDRRECLPADWDDGIEVRASVKGSTIGYPFEGVGAGGPFVHVLDGF